MLRPEDLNSVFVHSLLQYIVIPTRRSTAEALQITVIHLLGDAGSPFLIGLVRSSILPQSLKPYDGTMSVGINADFTPVPADF